MAFIKKAIYLNESTEVDPLNVPSWNEYNLVKLAAKVATFQKDNKSSELGGFDINAAIKDHPDNLFVKVFAIKKDEVNDNGDAWTGEELKRSASTFIGVPVFCNHQNDDIEKARGKVVHAWYDDEAGGIFIISMVDRIAYPKLARGIEEKYVQGTSMGTAVEHSMCSICRNVAKIADQYCFEGNTSILMSDFTTRAIKDIVIGDSVIDAYGNITKVTKTFIHGIKEKVSLIKSRAIDKELIVTKNHPFLVNRRGEYRYCPSEHLVDGEVLFTPVPKIDKNNYFFEKFGFENLSEKHKKMLMAFVGYYAAEGCFVCQDKDTATSLEIVMHKDELEYIEEIKIFAKEVLNKEVTQYPRNNSDAISLRIYDITFAEKISKICPGKIKNTHDKHLDGSVFTLNDEYKKEFLRTFVDGDGYSDNSNAITIVSASPLLSSQVFYILLSLGMCPSFGRYSNSGGPSNRSKAGVAYRISLGNSQLQSMAGMGVKFAQATQEKLTKSYRTQNIFTDDGLFTKHTATIDEIDFDGSVYNIETESHSYVANNTSVHNCDHVKNRKNRTFSGKVKDAYGKNGITVDGYDECPIKLAVDEDGYIIHKEAKVFEWNFGSKFIEDSFVVNPACRDCLVHEIFNESELHKKIANLKSTFTKLSSDCISGTCSVNGMKKAASVLLKEAGIEEINFLNNAMEQIERVAKSMMSQKQHVSMEFVSDLVEALANVQAIADELVEMGYGQLPSLVTSEGLTGTTVAAPKPVVPAPVQPQTKPSSPVSQDLGGMGSVTMPKTSENNNYEKKKEFIKVFGKFKDTIEVFSQRLENMYNVNNSKIKESLVMSTNKNSQSENQVQEKVASHDTSVITEKQLDSAKFTGERTNDSPSVITEKQLDNPKDVNVTTTDSPQKRKGSYDVITEKQLESITSGYITRWNDYPDVITEKQWDETSRLVGSLIGDQSNIITEKQLADFVSHHSYPVPTVITEKQLGAAKGETVERWADSKAIVKVAMDSMAQTIANFGKTPVEIVNSVKFINQNVKNLDKAAYVTLINSMPHKKEARVSEANRYGYFSKLASNVVTPSTTDALLTSLSSNISGYSADDVLVAMKSVANSPKGMAMVEASAKEILAGNGVVETVVNKEASFDNAINELDRPEDGMYQVTTDLSEIDAPLTNKSAFLKAVIKKAEAEINDSNVKVALTKVDIDEENELVVATFKDIEKLDEEEKKVYAQVSGSWLGSDPTAVAKKPVDVSDDYLDPSFGQGDEFEELESVLGAEPGLGKKEKPMMMASRKENREKLVKQAQMFGGQGGGGVGGEVPGGGGGGMGAGGGTTMPTPPAGGQPPLESFENTDMGKDVADGAGDELKPVPPGTKCPACGSDDVDVVSGKGECNNCGQKWWFETVVHLTGGVAGSEGKKEEGGEGFALPEEGGAAPGGEMDTAKGLAEASVEIDGIEKFAATTLITPEIAKKLKAFKIKLGSVSPVTGSKNTLDLGKNNFLCLDTGIPYSVTYRISTANPKNVFASWVWNPTLTANCDSCSRERTNFVKALQEVKVTEAQFDLMNVEQKGKTIVAMQEKGLLKTVKLASTDKKASAIETFKKVYAQVESSKFPTEMCQQKLANRFGLNAVALSGPCEGKPLADCICKSLKNNGIYSTKLAMAIGENWMEKEAQAECLQDYLEKYSLKTAQMICSYIKTKYAQIEDEISDEIALSTPEDNGPGGPDGLPTEEVDGIDAFGTEGGDTGTVSVELPLDLVEKLDAAIDTARGENPAEEAHHNVEVPDVEVEVEMPESAAEAVDTVVDKVLDENLGTEGAEGEVAPEGIVEEGAEVAPEGSAEIEIPGEGEVVVENETPEGASVEVKEEKPMNMDAAPAVAPTEKPLEAAPVAPVKPEPIEVVIVEEKKEENSGEKKEGKSEDKDNNKEVNDNPGVLNPETTTEKVEKEGDEEDKGTSEEDKEEKEMETTEKESGRMRTGYIGRTGTIGLDLSKVLEVVNKQTKTAKAPEQLNVQDVKEIGKYKNGKPIANENALTEKGPSVPHKGDASKIGKEEPAKTHPIDVPAGSAPIGGEKDNKALSGGDVTYTGGLQGAGTSKAASTRSLMNDLADRIIQASEKKIEKAEPVADDKDIKPIKDGKTIGDEPKLDLKEVKDGDVKSNDGFIGKEKETFKDKPDSPKDNPSIPAGDGKFKNEPNSGEKETKVKGTVIAESEDVKQVTAKATVIAGRMLEAGKITVHNLANKITELQGYKVAQLNDLEKAIFAKKGLNTESDGLEQSVVIGEKSNQRTSSDEISSKLASMFTLGKQNKIAQDIDSDFRKVYNRG